MVTLLKYDESVVFKLSLFYNDVLGSRLSGFVQLSRSELHPLTAFGTFRRQALGDASTDTHLGLPSLELGLGRREVSDMICLLQS